MDLEGFFGRSFHGQKSVSISAAKFEKVWKNSRYGKISPQELLEAKLHKLAKKADTMAEKLPCCYMISRVCAESFWSI